MTENNKILKPQETSKQAEQNKLIQEDNNKLMAIIMQSFQTMTKMTECMISVQESVLVLCHKLNDKEQDSELQ